MDRALTYVSRRILSGTAPEQEVADIVAAARSHNGSSRITGALAATASHFAQFLEGPGATLDELMSRIERDPRHSDLTILRVDAITHRRLPFWSMAYAGTSDYIARRIGPLIGVSNDGHAMEVERLVSLLIGLAGSAPARSP